MSSDQALAGKSMIEDYATALGVTMVLLAPPTAKIVILVDVAFVPVTQCNLTLIF